ncbi:ChrR family anti-sigma-E factor [Alteromonas sp. 1_MG-2023]|uniref:ChrR family anti-sigma-E factor n=1 Tax=Alteromonas sp. 1_MG-2023 TaxID=3062669 RepID=UPI0026E39526|nr:ChrR family anti-sigma-E factor [Alteromonas sp. 1_MG-2023]MDO6566151.1 ChrR family anti-sigma-E factor [Alteromonas sp. 1_MG-2023]
MIRFHPSAQQLVSFVDGNLSPAVSLMVSAHCDMCSTCQRFVEQETERLAGSLLEGSLSEGFLLEENGSKSADFNPDYSTMIAQITQTPSSLEADSGFKLHATSDKNKFSSSNTVPVVNTIANNSRESAIELDGKVFTLPRTLQRYIEKTGSWSSLVGKLWQAPVDLGSQGVANFIYMGKGGSVPEHTHRGTEYTLVLNGEFSDGLNSYDSGDFIFMDGQNTHTPRSDHSQGCLVFTIVDQPLHFTSGIARLLNPFSHLFFR